VGGLLVLRAVDAGGQPWHLGHVGRPRERLDQVDLDRRRLTQRPPCERRDQLAVVG